MLYLASILLLATTCVHGSYYRGWGYGGHSGYYNYYDRKDYCECPDVDGLIVTPQKEKYYNGETVELSCEEGYRFTYKRRNSTCRVYKDFFFGRGVFMPGIFDSICEELPLCRLPRVEGLKINSDKTLFEEGEDITISCEEGYELVGEDTYTCEIRKGYHGQYATFEVQPCEPPVQDGLIIEPMKESYAPGENISLACENGYELSVYETTTCQSNGQFLLRRIEKDDGKQRTREEFFIYFNQVCIQKAQCKVPNVDGMIVSPMKDTYETGDEITISCEQGYELRGKNKSVCTNEHGKDIFSYIRQLHGYGRFSPKITSYSCVEKEQCRTPKAQPGLILTPAKNSYDVGETVELSCEEGYELTDQTSAKCISNKKFLRRWGRMWPTRVHELSPWRDGLCKKTPTEKTMEDVEIETTTTFLSRVTFSIRPELLNPESMSTEPDETGSTGIGEDEQPPKA